ncbi:hypothetical protein PQX77_018399 [Marasmius sp. AFHP31]|nr:hypothetical protein PQX77_018399 [Marasmius sp. AFHP31]
MQLTTSIIALAVSFPSIASAMSITVGARQDGGRALHPNGDTEWCIVPFTPTFYSGAVIWPCAESEYTLWNFSEGETEIQSVGAPNLCLDSWFVSNGHGAPPTGSFDGANLHMDNCGQNTGNTPVTGWVVEGNTFKAAGSSNQCLDIQVIERGHGLQTFECAEGNTNQVWTS